MPFDQVRSLLFTPAADEGKLRRGLQAGADAVIWDLEDAVAASEKRSARARVVSLLEEDAEAPCLRFVRVNGYGTTEFGEDIAALAGAPIDGIVLPKATPAGVAALGSEGPPVLALVESAAGLRFAFETAESGRVDALLFGALDLAAELALGALPDGQELLAFRSHVVLASAAAGIGSPFDSPYVHVGDPEGLRAECRRARALGFRGKACIHPGQLPVVHEAFAPSAEEVAWAREVVEGFHAAGSGVASIAGQMIDRPVVERARRLLDDAERSRT